MTDSPARRVFSLPPPRDPMDFTGERFTPGIHGQIEHEHLHRYLFALQFCGEKDVLDIASGEGYGSALLSQVARSVVGVDIDAASVRFAADSYSRSNLSYKVGSASRVPVPDASVDVVVSFETIEHFAEHEAFLAEIKRVLRPGGLLVISSPDRDIYSKPGTAPNPFHVRELDKAEFHGLIRAHFQHAAFGCQKPVAGSLLLPDAAQERREAARLESFERQGDALFEREAGVLDAVYLIAVASDHPVPAAQWGALNDPSHFGRLLGEMAAKDSALAARAQQLTAKDGELAAKDGQLAAKDGQLAAKDSDLVAKDRELAAKDSQLAAKDGQLAAKDSDLAAKDRALAAKEGALAAKDRELAAMNRQLAAKAAEISRSAEQAEQFRSQLEASQVELSARKQEYDATHFRLQARVDAVELENDRTWRELVRVRVALHKSERKPSERWSKVLRAFRKAVPSSIEREKRQVELIRASGVFDREWYLTQYPDVARDGIDPVLHYLRHGAKEARDPCVRFSSSAYLRRHLDVASAGINPLVHFLEYGINEQRQTEPASGEQPPRSPIAAEPAAREPAGTGLTAEHLKFTSCGPDFEEFDPAILAGTTPDVKLLAFYLPQFHAIPENDQNWGKGFTEWRQIVRGLPRFPGHYQPRVPRDLGFYDLTEPSVMRRQVALAKAAGIYGFGFYYYWFDSRRVLEQPVEAFMASPDMDMPFMVIWTNENWTRTWDGMNGSILLHQNYDLRHESALLADLARHFSDPRYIRLEGRPFFVVYQPRHVPDPRQTFARWRERWRSEFGLEPIIFMAQTFGVEDPREFGLDGAMEFPPHKLTNTFPGRSVPNAFDPTFSGRVVNYDDVVAVSLTETEPAYPLIKSVVPSWDNDARRPLSGMILEGATPAKYESWLSQLAARAETSPVFGERIVAINAWNEWAEGAYLEPDLHYGSAYLNATARALVPRCDTGPRQAGKMVLVGHDALDFGAQRLLLNIAAVLVRQFGLCVHFVLLDGGPFVSRYRQLGSCTVLSDAGSPNADEVFAQLARQGSALAVTNTTVTGKLVPNMKAAGLRVLSLAHEMPGFIRNYGVEESAEAIARNSDFVVFAGPLVRDCFRQLSGEIAGCTLVRPQGLYRNEVAPEPGMAAAVRAEFGLPPDAKIALNVGYGDLRKGFDLFVRAAKAVARRRRDVYFLWVGKVLSAGPDVDSSASGARDNARVIALGQQEEVSRFYAAADVFFLSSREDPYPSVVLEAMAAGLPVVGFAGATGCEDLIKAHGTVVPAEDIDATVAAIDRFLEVPADRAQADAAARVAEIRANYDFKDYCFWLLRQFDPALRRVSVVVPNYNHERYLQERLGSIFRQSYPVYQVVILDDASSDGSVSAIKRIAAGHRREIALIAGEANSGSLARQWSKGLAQCTGDFVWIAESDDVADPTFLAECVQALERSGADFCFTDSWQIDGEGKRIGDSYVRYVDDIEPGTFDRDFDMAGEEFLRRFLSVKNVVLNMSGVLWRRKALVEALDTAYAEIEDFKLAADWRLYFESCSLGHKVAYSAKTLNGHRRHKAGVTSSIQKSMHIDEIARMQASIAKAVALDEKARQKAQSHMDHVLHHLGIQHSDDHQGARQ